tara:strand:- start:769 stop:1260 length:492 start_codon:yes stop_codon:yes gene_type:complete
MSWIVVNTKSNCEIKACSNLMRQGFKVFFPKIEKTVIRFKKICKTFKPLFPGYIFVLLEDNKNWTKINYTYGVFKILRFSEKIYYLPSEIMKNIKKNCNENGIFKKKIKIQKGEKITFIKNNFFTMDAVFDEYIDQNRAFIFLEFLKQKVKAKVKMSDIQIQN